MPAPGQRKALWPVLGTPARGLDDAVVTVAEALAEARQGGSDPGVAAGRRG